MYICYIYICIYIYYILYIYIYDIHICIISYTYGMQPLGIIKPGGMKKNIPYKTSNQQKLLLFKFFSLLNEADKANTI